MEDTFGAEALKQMKDLLDAEQDKDLTQISTVQGQFSALLSMLRAKGIFSEEDIHTWESKSIEMGEDIKELLLLGIDIAPVEVDGLEGEELENYAAKRTYMVQKTVDFCKKMGKTEIPEIALAILGKTQEQLNRETDQED